jgi:RNA polymerase subunit RPABC4/transcription elongation factor Spt4
VSDFEEVNDEYALLSAPVGVTGDKGAGGDKKPVTVARGYLDQWLSVHPTEGDHRGADPDAALFCRADREDTAGDHMSGEAVRKQLNKAARNAGIEEDRVHIHCFRHARVTYMKKSNEYDDMDIEHTLDWSEGTNQMKRYAHLDQDDKIASILESRGIDAELGKTTPEMKDCPRCMREIPYDARTCPYCTVRVSESPADWYQLYSELIEDDDDPLIEKYAGLSSTTPTMQRLPRDQFLWVEGVFRSLLFRFTDHLSDRPRAYDEILTKINLDKVTQDVIDAAEHILLTTSIEKNYQENQVEYKLSESEEFIEQLEAGFPVPQDESDIESTERIYGELLSEDDNQ